MTDLAPEFEITDELGATKLFAGTVGTTAVLVNSPSLKEIDEILIRCPSQSPNTKVLMWSFDNVTFHKLSVGEFVGWEPRKDPTTNQKITGVYLKGSVAGVEYEVIINSGAT